MTRYSAWILGVGCVAIAVAILLCFDFPKSRPDAKKVSAAEDKVYEAVIRDLITAPDGQVKIRQLVFEENVLTELSPGGDIETCKEKARKNLRLEESAPQYNSLVDKIYRFFHGGNYRPIQADTIQDFLRKSCTAGRLSQTFHTDLPKSFIGVESIHFEGGPIERNGSKSFEQLFPGAGGVISFSHVGFDPALREAIVVVSDVCGGLCGSGHRYILRKKQAHWAVVSKMMLWIS